MRGRWGFLIGIALLIGIGCAILTRGVLSAATVEPFQAVAAAAAPDPAAAAAATESKIQTIMRGAAAEAETFKIEIPRSLATWALERAPATDAVAIRADLLANWNQRFTEYTTATAAATAADTTWSSDPKQNTCNVLQSLSTRYYQMIQELRPRVQDLSGSVYTFVQQKDANFAYQNTAEVFEKCMFSQSPACRELANQDKLIVDALPKYESTNTTMFEKEIEIREAIEILNQIAATKSFIREIKAKVQSSTWKQYRSFLAIIDHPGKPSGAPTSRRRARPWCSSGRQSGAHGGRCPHRR
jgi:hypothetical protein